MRKLFTILVAALLTASVFAQSPEKMSYQAVIRDASNNLVANQTVGMQISILQNSAGGSSVYVETQTPTTNDNGLVSIEIGGVTGFDTINWANGLYFIKTEIDPTGGSTYTIIGTSQLMSVPYALHAKTAENITGTVVYTETDPVFGASIANGITTLDTANWNNHTIDTDTHIDSTGIATLGFVAGTHTIDTDTQLDSTDIANMGYVAGAGSSFTDNFYLGQDTLGGIVYYIYKDATGTQHGLIVNKNEIYATWQIPPGTLTNADRTDDGLYNTTQMTDTDSDPEIYVTGLGTGWYLPSIDELALLYYNRFLANKALRTGDFTLLSATTSYWSSTEESTYLAYSFSFETGTASATIAKNAAFLVRAVRAF